MGLLKNIVMPALGIDFPGRKKKDEGYVRTTSASGGGIDEKRTSGMGGGYIGDEAARGNYKRGGVVKRTGLAKVHKGERVLTRSQAKRYRRGSSKR